jgi:hypothetical protein
LSARQSARQGLVLWACRGMAIGPLLAREVIIPRHLLAGGVDVASLPSNRKMVRLRHFAGRFSRRLELLNPWCCRFSLATYPPYKKGHRGLPLRTGDLTELGFWRNLGTSGCMAGGIAQILIMVFQ